MLKFVKQHLHNPSGKKESTKLYTQPNGYTNTKHSVEHEKNPKNISPRKSMAKELAVRIEAF